MVVEATVVGVVFMVMEVEAIMVEEVGLVVVGIITAMVVVTMGAVGDGRVLV
jgi:hypothetical protein